MSLDSLFVYIVCHNDHKNTCFFHGQTKYHWDHKAVGQMDDQDNIPGYTSPSSSSPKCEGRAEVCWSIWRGISWKKKQSELECLSESSSPMYSCDYQHLVRNTFSPSSKHKSPIFFSSYCVWLPYLSKNTSTQW